MVCAVRIALKVVSVGRVSVAWAMTGIAPPSETLTLGVGTSVVLVAFSAWILVRYRREVAPGWLLGVSVTLDAAICFGALLPLVLTPHPDYPGIIRKPDIAAPILLALLAALRLSPGLVIWASVLGLASIFGLVALDAGNAGPPLADVHVRVDLSFLLVFQVAASLLALITAIRTRGLVEEGALRAVRVEHAERNLGALMQDQHDVRTLLSSASLNADLVLRRLRRGEKGGAIAEIAEQVREDLDRVNEFVVNIRERSYEDLMALRAPAAAHVATVFERVAQQLRSRFPEVGVCVEGDRSSIASVAGGELALSRVALNLLVNACEGDGKRGASRIDVRVHESGEHVLVEVQDDGPGFDPFMLDPTASGYTSKRDGSGLGLAFVREVLHASGGRELRRNLEGGGAVVALELRRS
jgi:signal transduction histidine kinase